MAGFSLQLKCNSKLQLRPSSCLGHSRSGMVAVDHGENLDPAHVTALELAHGRADIGKNAALAGRDDHQLEIFGAVLVDTAGERRREIHFGNAGGERGISFVDDTIRNTGKACAESRSTGRS